jgi:hypothetical protein
VEAAGPPRPSARLWARRSRYAAEPPSIDGWATTLFAPAADPAAVERDAYEERAAILEYDAGAPRAEAEPRAAALHPSEPERAPRLWKPKIHAR